MSQPDITANDRQALIAAVVELTRVIGLQNELIAEIHAAVTAPSDGQFAALLGELLEANKSQATALTALRADQAAMSATVGMLPGVVADAIQAALRNHTQNG